METIAEEHDVEITEFDAQFDPDLQQRQLRDAIASGEYDGIILTAIVVTILVGEVIAWEVSSRLGIRANPVVVAFLCTGLVAAIPRSWLRAATSASWP